MRGIGLGGWGTRCARRRACAGCDNGRCQGSGESSADHAAAAPPVRHQSAGVPLAMSPLADARFLLTRALGLARRSWVSVHTRGWRASWAQARLHLQPRAMRGGAALYMPAPAPFAPFAVPMARSATPRATIVIPVFDQLAHTLACLRAL